MKQQFFRYMSGALPAVVLFSSLHAQPQNSLMKSNPNQRMHNEFKTSPSASFKDNDIAINEHAVTDFSKNFKNSGAPSWFRIKDGFLAKSEKDGTHIRVFYDLKGRWSSTILTYGEDKLPSNVRRLVKSTYYDHKIYMVNEISIGEQIIYMVSIEDKEGYKTIRVTDEETSVYEEFSK